MKKITTTLSVAMIVTLTSAAQSASVLTNGGFEISDALDSNDAGVILGSELSSPINFVNSSNGFADFSGTTGDGSSVAVKVENWTGSSRIWYAVQNGGNNVARLNGAGRGSILDTLDYEGISLTAGDSVELNLTAFAGSFDSLLFARLTDGANTINLLAAGIVIDVDDQATQAVNSGSFLVNSTGTYTLQVYADQSNQTNNHIYVDDIDLDVTPVPEPSSTLLLGLSAFSFLLRRRR